MNIWLISSFDSFRQGVDEQFVADPEVTHFSGNVQLAGDTTETRQCHLERECVQC